MIDNLISEIKQNTDFQINRRALKEKILTDLHMVYANGLFLASAELIAFVSCWETDELVIEDVYSTPVKVQREEFLQQLKQTYQTAMNAWHFQYEQLRTARKV